MKVYLNKKSIKSIKAFNKPTKIKGIWLCTCGGSLKYIPLLKKRECNVCKKLYSKEDLG